MVFAVLLLRFVSSMVRSSDSSLPFSFAVSVPPDGTRSPLTEISYPLSVSPYLGASVCSSNVTSSEGCRRYKYAVRVLTGTISNETAAFAVQGNGRTLEEDFHIFQAQRSQKCNSVICVIRYAIIFIHICDSERNRIFIGAPGSNTCGNCVPVCFLLVNAMVVESPSLLAVLCA